MFSIFWTRPSDKLNSELHTTPPYSLWILQFLWILVSRVNACQRVVTSISSFWCVTKSFPAVATRSPRAFLRSISFIAHVWLPPGFGLDPAFVFWFSIEFHLALHAGFRWAPEPMYSNSCSIIFFRASAVWRIRRQPQAIPEERPSRVLAHLFANMLNTYVKHSKIESIHTRQWSAS